VAAKYRPGTEAVESAVPGPAQRRRPSRVSEGFSERLWQTRIRPQATPSRPGPGLSFAAAPRPGLHSAGGRRSEQPLNLNGSLSATAADRTVTGSLRGKPGCQ
jgi:hypothetical protein